jgi:hypothetical protein
MNIGIYHLKHNRPFYSVLASAFVEGLKRHGQKCEVITNRGSNFCPKQGHDLAVSFTNAESKVGKVLEKQIEVGGGFLTVYMGAFSRNGIVDFSNRNQIYGWDTNQKPQDDALVYCDVLGYDYNQAGFCKGKSDDRLKKLNGFGIELKPFRDDGFILIPEQVRPEGRGHNSFDWSKWVVQTCKIIRSRTDRPIKIRRHPNRYAWKHYKDYDFGVSGVTVVDGRDYPLDEDLDESYAVVTISSKCNIEGLIEGCHSFTEDMNSLAYCVSNRSLQYIDNPIRYSREQWLADVAYTHWGIDEIANGDYWSYLKLFLGNFD